MIYLACTLVQCTIQVLFYVGVASRYTRTHERTRYDVLPKHESTHSRSLWQHISDRSVRCYDERFDCSVCLSTSSHKPTYALAHTHTDRRHRRYTFSRFSPFVIIIINVRNRAQADVERAIHPKMALTFNDLGKFGSVFVIGVRSRGNRRQSGKRKCR